MTTCGRTDNDYLIGWVKSDIVRNKHQLSCSRDVKENNGNQATAAQARLTAKPDQCIDQ